MKRAERLWLPDDERGNAVDAWYNDYFERL
jgi:hypothetical protein